MLKLKRTIYVQESDLGDDPLPAHLPIGLLPVLATAVSGTDRRGCGYLHPAGKDWPALATSAHSGLRNGQGGFGW